MSFSNLPLASEILDSHRCKVEPECYCQDKPISPILVEDARLKNWKEWMKKRKNMHQKLGSLLQRDACTLIMNSAEEIRTMRENQIAFDYARIPKPDPQRGCPGFWKTGIELKATPTCPTPCYGVLTKEDKCEIPIIEHVSVPNEIQKEKDVYPMRRVGLDFWERSQYIHNKRAYLREQLDAVVPHKPEAEELVITGSAIGKGKNIIKKSTQVQTSYCKEESDIYQKPSVLSLLINDLHVSPHADLSGTRKIYTFFDYDINDKKIATKHLKLQNLGTTTIRFSWQIVEMPSLFRDLIPLKSLDNCFYFNKNEDVILPGHTLDFPFWFKSESTGVFFEQWELLTKPRVMPPNLKVVVALHASAITGDLFEKIATIKAKLDTNMRNRLIKESLNDVLGDIPYVKTKPIVYMYNKREIFETVNSKFNAFNQEPNYLYDKNVVRELQKFYKAVRRPMDPKCWNYRIDELRLLTKAKDKEDEKLRTLSDQREAKIKITADHSLKEQPVTKNATGDAWHFTKQLNDIISKLEKPTVKPNIEREKLVQAYLIFSSCITKMENDLEELKEKVGIIKVCKYPKLPSDYTPFLKMPSRLVHERLHEIFQGPQLREGVGLPSDQPPAECLLEIPIDNYRKRYRTYYNIPDTPPPKGAKGAKGAKSSKSSKGGKDDKKGKDKKSDKGKNKGKGEPKEVESDEDQGMVIDRLFDPYAYVEPPFESYENWSVGEESEAECVNNFDLLSPATLSQYRYNTYVIVYKHLENAVMNIADMIEGQQKKILPYGVIKEVENQKYNSRLIDLKGLIAQEAIDKANAKLILTNYRKNCKKDFEAFERKKQLKRKKSDTSLWSLLRQFRSEEQFNTKPISYPMDHYNEIKKSETGNENFVQATTSTSGAKLDPNWPDFKDVQVQQDYEEGEEPEDLQAYVEKVVSEISLNDLIDKKFNKATQKNLEDYVSDEEPFYDDVEVDRSSINSEPSDPSVEVCLCEDVGVCCNADDVEDEENQGVK